MNNDKPKSKPGESAGKIPLKRLVMIAPFVEPEHEAMISKAESQLKEYEDSLLEKLKHRFDYLVSTEPPPTDVKKAHREFYEDPFRRHMIKLISDMKLMFEMPRFMVKES